MEKKKPKSIVLEVQSLRHINTTVIKEKKKEKKDEEKDNG